MYSCVCMSVCILTEILLCGHTHSCFIVHIDDELIVSSWLYATTKHHVRDSGVNVANNSFSGHVFDGKTIQMSFI